jgi:hypothetical protein
MSQPGSLTGYVPMIHDTNHRWLEIAYGNGCLYFCDVCGREGALKAEPALGEEGWIWCGSECETAATLTKSHKWGLTDQGPRHHSVLYTCTECGLTSIKDTECQATPAYISCEEYQMRKALK